jgi:hypothetical protein
LKSVINFGYAINKATHVSHRRGHCSLGQRSPRTQVTLVPWLGLLQRPRWFPPEYLAPLPGQWMVPMDDSCKG